MGTTPVAGERVAARRARGDSEVGAAAEASAEGGRFGRGRRRPLWHADGARGGWGRGEIGLAVGPTQKKVWAPHEKWRLISFKLGWSCLLLISWGNL